MINSTKNNMIIYHLLLSTIQKDDWLRCFFGLIKATSQTQMMIHKPLVLSSLVVFFTTCVYSLYHKTSNDQFHGPCFSNDINDYKYD